MPRNQPATSDTIKKARKGLSFAQEISNTSERMQSRMITNVVMINEMVGNGTG
jgi:hypothetical protein